MTDEYGEEVYDTDTMFDSDNVPFTDDRARATAMLPISDTGRKFLDKVANMPLSVKMKSGLKDDIQTFLSKDILFSHNKSVGDVMRAYDLSVITLDFLKSPRDAEYVGLPPLLRSLRFAVQSRATRTIGGKVVDERTRQYEPMTTQRVEQYQKTQHELPQHEPLDEGGL